MARHSAWPIDPIPTGLAGPQLASRSLQIMTKATHLASVLPITLLSLAVGAAPALASDLLVDVNDPDANLPGDNLYAQSRRPSTPPRRAT